MVREHFRPEAVVIKTDKGATAPHLFPVAGMRTQAVFGLVCLLIAGTLGCQRGPAADAAHDEKISVFVSVLPQVYFVERVGGERVAVQVLAQPGQNPHNFDATPRQVVELSRARLYFSIGVEFEPTILAKLRSEGGPEIVSMNAGLTLLPAACEHGHDEGEGHHHDHAHAAGEDPHVWLDPKRVRTLARNTLAALARIDPERRAEYERNTDAFLAELDALDVEIAAILQPFAGREFFVYHPAYAYFAESYGLKQVAIEREGKSPQGRELLDVIRRMEASGVRTIFYEPQFDRSAMELVARELGARAVEWDGLARDWPTALRRAAAALKAAFDERPA